MGQLGDILYTNARIRGAGILDALREGHYQHKLRLQRNASNAKHEEIDTAWNYGKLAARQERQAELDHAVATSNLCALDALAWQRVAFLLNNRLPEDKRLDAKTLQRLMRLQRINVLATKGEKAKDAIAAIRKVSPEAAVKIGDEADDAEIALRYRGIRSEKIPV